MVDVSDRSFASSNGLDIGQRLTAAAATDILNLRERNGRNKALGLPCLADLCVELVDLFKRKTLGLVDGEIHKRRADQTESTPDEEHLGPQVRVAWTRVHHVGSSVGDGPVEQPVGGRGHGEGLGAGLEREKLSSDDPSNWAPRAGEEEDVDADESDQNLVRNKCTLAGGGTDYGDDKLGDAHADSTEEEKRTTTPLLDHIKTWEGREDVDDVGDQADDERILNTRALEERSTVVEDEVDASELLQGLKTATGSETLAQGTPEAFGIR